MDTPSAFANPAAAVFTDVGSFNGYALLLIAVPPSARLEAQHSQTEEARGWFMRHECVGLAVDRGLQDEFVFRISELRPPADPTRSCPDGRRAVDAWTPLDGRNINGDIRLKF